MNDQIDNAINSEFAINRRKNKVIKALEMAKQLERKQAKKPVRLNSKTIVLR